MEMTIKNLLRLVDQAQEYRCNGRIRKITAMWVPAGDKPSKRSCGRYSTDEGGRRIELVYVASVTPQCGWSDAPRASGYQVSWRECLSCPQHIKPGPGRRYHCCRWLAERNAK